MLKNTNIIVTDVRYRMSLPVIRDLGRAGARIIAADLESTPEDAALGFFSKYTHARAHLPSPSDETAFFSALTALADGTKPVLMPVGIDTMLTLCAHREELDDHFYTALPPLGSIETANDKYALMRHASGHGIPCPATTTLREGEEVSSLAARVRYPAVIKYRAGELLRLDPKDRYCIVATPEELCSKFEKMHALQSHPLVQEYVPGKGFGVSVVMDKNHNPIKVFCHRRLREYPISGGPSCLCESAWDAELAQHAVSLLRSLDWVGVAMVEFKGTPDSGYKLMEINPRFWGSLALAPISGCDIPCALARAALGETAPSGELKPDYQLGRKMRFRLQDTLAFFKYVKREKKKLSFSVNYIASLFNPHIKDGVFSFSDPKPGVKYLRQALKKKSKIIR